MTDSRIVCGRCRTPFLHDGGFFEISPATGGLFEGKICPACVRSGEDERRHQEILRLNQAGLEAEERRHQEDRQIQKTTAYSSNPSVHTSFNDDQGGTRYYAHRELTAEEWRYEKSKHQSLLELRASEAQKDEEERRRLADAKAVRDARNQAKAIRMQKIKGIVTHYFWHTALVAAVVAFIVFPEFRGFVWNMGRK